MDDDDGSNSSVPGSKDEKDKKDTGDGTIGGPAGQH
jgi:hypothetical protein